MNNVFVYKNLSNGKWSIRATAGPHKGKVIGHADEVALYNVCTKVSEAGRQRVIAEQQKNVHAGVTGCLDGVVGFEPYRGREIGNISHEPCERFWRMHSHPQAISYNPYRSADFYYKSSGAAFISSGHALLHSGGVHVSN